MKVSCVCEARCYKKPNYKESLHNFLQAHINMILWFFNRNKSNSSVSLAGFQFREKDSSVDTKKQCKCRFISLWSPKLFLPETGNEVFGSTLLHVAQ